MFRAAYESHLPLTLINDWDLKPESLARFAVIVLPNAAALSDAQHLHTALGQLDGRPQTGRARPDHHHAGGGAPLLDVRQGTQGDSRVHAGRRGESVL